MTTPDRTEDLLRLMLERRAGAPPPGWLLPGVAEAVRQTGQARTGLGWPGLPGTRRFGRLALVAAAALVLLALAAGVLVAARLILPPPQPTLPAIVVAPSPSTTVPPATPEPTEAPASQQQPPATAAPPAFSPDTIAVVTTAGDGLRVRSKPSVGADSKKLSPLLRKGSRLLIVDGPVTADTYDWYEVQADNDQFGWVAAGKGSEDWIAPGEPNCADNLDESAVRTIDPIDFLACFGDTPVSVHVGWSALEDGIDTEGAPACPYTGDNVQCSARPNWLFEPHEYTFVTPGRSPDLLAAAHGSVLRDVREVPEPLTMTLTIAMDAPQAQDCRVVDNKGRDLISRDEAITRCRLTFVVRDVARERVTSVTYATNSMARVDVDNLAVRSAPGLGAGSTLLPTTLAAGSTVYIDAGPVSADGIDWYAVLWTDMESVYGWVPSIESGAPTLAPLETACAPMKDWPAFVNLSFKERLVCFDDQPVTVRMRVRVMQDARPEWSLACSFAQNDIAAVGVNIPCSAEPAWLATFSGIVGHRPGEMEEPLVFDPSLLKRADFPADYKWKVVTGTFAHPTSASCRATDPDTGVDLLPPAEAAIYCRSKFVVTKVEAIP